MKLRNLFKPSYIGLGAGFIAGAVATISIISARIVPPALAGEPASQVRQIGGISTTDMTTLRSLNDSFAALAEYVAPSVVHIKSEGARTTDLMGRAMMMGGQGSGVIFRSDGYIVTNDHVVGGFDNVTVILNDGREFRGKVIRSDNAGDIALIKIDAKNLTAAKFGDSGKVKPGQFAIAVGSPFGFENSVTVGHISGLQRENFVTDARLGRVRPYFDMIQTDAAINPGNSGGALLNVDGDVVGINTSIYSETGGNMGIGFAIPSNQARMIAEMLIEKGKVNRSFLGVEPQNLKPFQKDEMSLSGGAQLAKVENDSPAAKAGLKEGDIVVRIGDYPISTQVDLRNAMLRYEPGSSVKVEYVRNGDRQTADVKLGSPPAAPKAQQEPGPEDPFSNESPMPRLDLKGIDPKMREFFKGFKGDRMFSDPQDETPRRPQVRGGSARLGVIVESVGATQRKQFSIPAGVEGAVVTSVEPGSVAERIGIEPGDVIQNIGDVVPKNAEQLAKAMKGVRWGESRRIKVSRYSKSGVSTQIRDVTFN